MCAPAYNLLTRKSRKSLNLRITQKEYQKLKLTRNTTTCKDNNKKHIRTIWFTQLLQNSKTARLNALWNHQSISPANNFKNYINEEHTPLQFTSGQHQQRWPDRACADLPPPSLPDDPWWVRTHWKRWAWSKNIFKINKKGYFWWDKASNPNCSIYMYK